MRYLLILLPFLFLGCASEIPERPPNIIIMLSDDQGYGDLGFTGNPWVETPNIDRLASEGATFRHFYVSPVCSPTRAEMLTGRYYPRGGVYDTSAGGERLDLDEVTLAQVFRSAGYATGAYGKWHNGQQYPYHPNARGFDDFYGFAAGHWGNYFDALLEHNGEYLKGNGYMPDDLTARAMEFMELHSDDPFLLYIPYNTPHSPMQVPEEYWVKFSEWNPGQNELTEEQINHTRAAYAMCENLDWNVGRILKKLDELNLSEETIILYFSDNGPNGHRWNAGLRGIKGSTDEGGVRSPLVMRWPGQIDRGHEVLQVSGAIDLLPTLVTLAGIDWVPENPLDGKDISSHVLGDIHVEERVLASHWGGRTSIRTQHHRLDHQNRLYNMDNDPGQTTEVQNDSIMKALISIKQQWENEVLSELPANDDRLIPIAGSDFPATILPARDAQFTSGITRSNRWPNDSFLIGLQDPADSVYWDIEVLESGSYSFTVYYTAKEPGAEVSVRAGEERISAEITEPFDPPLRGMENDRVQRGESYVKDFRPLTLGSLHMKKGRGILSLKTEVAASPIDFRMLEIKKMD